MNINYNIWIYIYDYIWIIWIWISENKKRHASSVQAPRTSPLPSESNSLKSSLSSCDPKTLDWKKKSMGDMKIHPKLVLLVKQIRFEGCWEFNHENPWLTHELVSLTLVLPSILEFSEVSRQHLWDYDWIFVYSSMIHDYHWDSNWVCLA